jgi:segregation and condensation protein B
METKQLKNIIEAALLAAESPLTVDQMMRMFEETPEPPGKDDVKKVIEAIDQECADKGYELKQVASGYRFQTDPEIQPWLSRLRVERPPRYSRAFLETLSLIVYRQPITRAEIEDVRGVSISSSIFKVLLEREWIKIVGYKELPGKPAMYGTTRKFLDYFNIKSLSELPPLAEIRDIDDMHPEFEFGELEDTPSEQEAAPVQLEVIEGGTSETRH